MTLSSGVRCVEALRLLSKANDSLALQDIAAALKLHPSTAHRVVATLVSQGFAEQGEDRRYRLGLEAFAVGAGYLRQSAMRRVALPALMRLAERAGTSAYLAYWQDGKAVIVDAIPMPGMYHFHSEIGSVVPPYASGIGKALLAFQDRKAWAAIGPLQRLTANTTTSAAALAKELERIRRNGYSIDNEEVVPGCRCVGAPVPNGVKAPLAAISVSGPPTIVSPTREPELARLVQETCFQVAAQLGCQPATYPLNAERWSPRAGGAIRPEPRSARASHPR